MNLEAKHKWLRFEVSAGAVRMNISLREFCVEQLCIIVNSTELIAADAPVTG